MHNLTDNELKTLQDAKTPKEWRRACEDIKAARKGLYPPDWWSKAITSGLMAKANGHILKAEEKKPETDIYEFLAGK